jgi:sec-independent protein translocase protein TatB
MFGLGFSEIVLLAIIALVVVGPKQLPDVARTIGRFLNELKRATDDFKDEFKRQAKVDLEIEKISLRPQAQSNEDEYQKHIGGAVSHQEDEKQLSLDLTVENSNEPKKSES